MLKQRHLQVKSKDVKLNISMTTDKFMKQCTVFIFETVSQAKTAPAAAQAPPATSAPSSTVPAAPPAASLSLENATEQASTDDKPEEKQPSTAEPAATPVR